MGSWITTYIGMFVIVLAALLVMVEVVSRWAAQHGNSDRYLSRRWVRELNGK